MTRRGIAVWSWGSTLASRGSVPQHVDEAPLPATEYQSVVHSQTFPIMSESP